jgi:hypothetical protein
MSKCDNKPSYADLPSKSDCDDCAGQVEKVENMLNSASKVRAVPRIFSEPQQVQELQKSDLVNHPSHYTDGGIETIDFIEAKKLNYHIGNAVKYLSRAGKKGSSKVEEIQDLDKAIWYIRRRIEQIDKN